MARVRLTRRELVVAAGALAGGCLSGESNVRYPTERSNDGGELLAQERTATPTEKRRQNPRLAARTERIYDELRWFATEYDAMLDAYLGAVDRSVATVERVVAQGEINRNTIDAIESTIEGSLLSVIAERVEPHFAVEGYVTDHVDTHLRVTRTFAARGDIDRAQEELARLRAFLDGLGRSTFVGRQLSVNPVRNRLLATLRGPETRPALFELYEHRSGFRTYAYGGPSGRLRGDAFDDATTSTYDALFAPALNAARTGAMSVVVRPLPGAGQQSDPLPAGQYPGTGVLVQRFGGSDAAEEAEDGLVGSDGPLAGEGTTRLAGRDGRRVYYRAIGDVQYAFLVRAGRYLVLVAPGETAWNERIDWTDGVARSWLWRRP